MKQTNKIWILNVFSIALLMIFATNVIAIGVAPSKTILDYNPGQQTRYSIDIINNGHEDLEVIVYAKGEYSSNVKILNPMTKLSSTDESKKITVEFTMPESIETAGTHEIDIVAVGSTQTKKSQKAVVKADIAVISKLIIDVPYPEKYAEARVYVLDSQEGRPITVDVPVFNKGSQDINEAYAKVEIYSSDGTKFDELTSSRSPIAKGEQVKFTMSSKKQYMKGEYVAKATAVYDSRGTHAETRFSIGELTIDIKSLVVESFTLGDVAKFDILLFNAWNTELKNVYAQMQIYGSDNKVYTDFKTVATDIPAQGVGRLEGYWYTTGVEPGIYHAKITLYYANKMTQKDFELEVQPNAIIARSLATGEAISAQEAVNFQKSGYLILVILVMTAVIGVLVYKLKKRPKNISPLNPPLMQAMQQSIPQSTSQQTSTTTVSTSNQEVT